MKPYPTKEVTKEVIFIGFPSPTHHYGGLSADNVASSKNRHSESSPKQAALQAVELMRYLLSLGQIVGVLPPQLRPHLPLLTERGFGIETAPLELLEKASSSSAMWVANAGTISPVADSADRKLHITTANLQSNIHRRIEAQATHQTLTAIFATVPNVILHNPLRADYGFLDEGAANHMRLAPSHNDIGLNVFAYGGRQNLKALRAIAANHCVFYEHALFVEQNPQVIAQGVFHNDVIAVSNENLLLVHELAYANGRSDIAKIESAYKKLHPNGNLQTIIISSDDLSVAEAVHSYFFNSQIITKPNGKMTVIAPQEIEILHNGKAAKLLGKICADSNNSIEDFVTLDLRQSMRNGGGPACLRLRVPMTDEQLLAISKNTAVLMNNDRLLELTKLAEKYYPETLNSEGLRSPELFKNCKSLLAEMKELLRCNISTQ